MAKIVLADDDEPKGKYFYPVAEKYCSFCDQLIEIEFWRLNGDICHLCGEYHYLYEKD